MKLTRFLASAILLAFTVSLSAATPPGKTQQITSPDQVPDGLAKSDWQSIRAAYEAGRHLNAQLSPRTTDFSPRLESQPSLRLRVEEHGALYPLTIDPNSITLS